MSDPLSFEEALQAIRWTDSYSWLPQVLELAGRMNPVDWWRLLGEEWSGFDNIAAHQLEVARLLKSATAAGHSAAMSATETADLKAMPEMLTIYRGSYGHNGPGLSWTLERSVGARIVSLN